VTLLYDGDGPGLKATFRAADVFLAAGLRVLVATLPPGEDPDTLAAKGGKAALDVVLNDAIDVCERKIQLLDRKGWLGNLAGRRKALDRLLPTLRAPVDPVTRDLYVTRTAEALGITRDAVLLEVGKGPRGVRAAPPRDEPAAAASPVERTGPASGRPERDLLRAMLREPEWRSRVAELVPDRSIMFQPERDLIERLIAEPTVQGGAILGEVEGEARELLHTLLEHPWGAINVDAIVDGAIGRLQSRPLQAELDELQRALPFAGKPEQDKIAQRVRSLHQEIARLNPGHWKNTHKKGRTGAI
jgi:DNA primase